MSQLAGDLVTDLSLDTARFDEQISRVRCRFSGLDIDAKETTSAVEQDPSCQALAARRAGIPVGRYKAAMRTLPAQFTDIATQLAGGQNPWLIPLQQGGQVKDSFSGMIPMFRGLTGAITLSMVGVTLLAMATGALAYTWHQGDATLSEFNKMLVLSDNQAGLTVDRMLMLSRTGQAVGLAFNQARESLAALVNAGVRGGGQFDAINQNVTRLASASGVEADEVAEAFGELTTDPTSGLVAMARQFHNVTAEQIAYAAQLQRSRDEAGVLQAANDIVMKDFDEQIHRLEENMGTLEIWTDKTGRAFKSAWDAILGIGRPESSADILASAQKTFDEMDKEQQWYQSRSQRRGKISSFRANLQGAWDDRENAHLGLAAATLQSGVEKAGKLAARDRAGRKSSQLKYIRGAQKAHERLQMPLDKYTTCQKELNKASKDGKALQADYNTPMASAEKGYGSTLKKPPGVEVSTGERQEDRAHAALLAFETEFRTLEKHGGVNEKISRQRRDLREAESQYMALKEATTEWQLSEQEKFLLAHGRGALEYKHQLAELGDRIEHQKRLNELTQQATRFEQQQSAKQAVISAEAHGPADCQVWRESEGQCLRGVYGDSLTALVKVTLTLKNTWSVEEQLHGSWMAGMESGRGEWAESAMDGLSQVKSVATQTSDGIAQNMAAMLTGSEQNWWGFTRSILPMMIEILLKQAMVGAVGNIGSAIGGIIGDGASVSGGTAIQAAVVGFHFTIGGFTGTGGKYKPTEIVHRGGSVLTKEVISRTSVGNLYRLMRGYATGGYVDAPGSLADSRSQASGTFEQSNHMVINSDGTNGQIDPAVLKAVYDMARKGARDEIQTQMRDGGLFSGGGR